MEEEVRKNESPAQQPEQKLPPERAEQEQSFQELIRGKYREDYARALAQALESQAREASRYLAWRELCHKAETLRSVYPDFDLEQELENPEFARLVEDGVEPRTAYEVLHFTELHRREERLARNAERPLENGVSCSSQAAVTRADPRTLSRAERRALRRRAARGEEIVW